MPQLLRDVFGPVYAPVLAPAIRIVWIVIIGYLILKIIDSALTRLRLLIPASDVLGVARVERSLGGPQVTLGAGGALAIVTQGATPYDGDAAVRLRGDVVAELEAVVGAL